MINDAYVPWQIILWSRAPPTLKYFDDGILSRWMQRGRAADRVVVILVIIIVVVIE